MAFDRKDFYARTMHTPDTPERAELRAALRHVSKALLPLHRRLIDVTKDDYEFAFAPVASPSQLLQLVTNDDFFAWLKPITSLIVAIDEMARTDFEAPDVAAITARLDQLFGASPAPEFAERYLALLQRDADVTIGHAALRKAMMGLRRS